MMSDGKRGKDIKILLTLLSTIFVFSPLILFGANKNIGTTGAPFLKIGAGARPVAMGEAFTGIADDVNSVAWNPSGLGTLKQGQFTAMHSQWLQEADYEFVAAAYPLPKGTFGFGFASLTVDGIEKRLTDTDTPDGTFGSNDSVYTFAYGVPLWKTWNVGLGFSYIRQELDGDSASGIAGSLGLLWQTPHNPLDIGLSVRNLGSEIKFIDEGDPLPTTFGIGAGYKAMSDRLILGLDLRQPKDTDLQFGGGVEFTQPFFSDMSGAFRAGYNSASSDGDGSGMSIGFGLSWRHWRFDLAWVPYGVLGDSFRYALVVKF